MHLNNYNYHFCDRFVLLLVAVVGLVGTSYILLNESAQQKKSIESISIGFQQKNNQQNLSDFMTTLDSGDNIIPVKPDITVVHNIQK